MREARDFIAQDNPDAADRLVALIGSRAETLLLFPAAGRRTETGRRSLALPPTSYRLIYRRAANEILILSVWHGARTWPHSEA
jgi:plasmid stabilization system protein ParE